ncbi:MAG: hypothetical protein ABIR96_01340 [Bdellovibrionota bacterium]
MKTLPFLATLLFCTHAFAMGGSAPGGPLYDETTRCKDLPANLRESFFQTFREDVASSGSSETRIQNYMRILGYAPRESSGYTLAANDEMPRTIEERQRGLTGQEVYIDRVWLDNKHWKKSNSVKASLESYRVIYGRESSTYTLKNREFMSHGRLFRRGETVSKFTIHRSTSVGLIQVSADQLGRGNTRAYLASLVRLAQTDPNAAATACLTRLYFSDSPSQVARELNTLARSCTPGTTSDSDVLCFDKWTALCPAFNIRLGLLLPDAYFAQKTKDKSAPQCESEFRKIAASL